MADVKISDLTVETAPLSTALVEIETALGASKKVNLSNLTKGFPWTTIHGESNTAGIPAASSANAGHLWHDTQANTILRSDGSVWAIWTYDQDYADNNLQPLDAELTAIAGLTSAADKGIQFTGAGTAGMFDLTAAGKALLDDADAGAQRTTLGLGGAAVLAVGTTAGTVAAGDHTHTQFTTQAQATWEAGAGTTESVVSPAKIAAAIAALAPSSAAGTATFLIRSPLQNEPPASAFATLDTRNSIPCLDFDAAADESAIFSGFAPEAIVLTSGIIARIVWAATSATSGNVRWRVKFERRTTDQDSDSWDTATEATGAANGTSGICTTTEITCTTIDSIVAGDSFRVCVTRVGTDGTNDTMTGDAELVSVELRAA